MLRQAAGGDEAHSLRFCCFHLNSYSECIKTSRLVYEEPSEAVNELKVPILHLLSTDSGPVSWAGWIGGWIPALLACVCLHVHMLKSIVCTETKMASSNLVITLPLSPH